MWARHRARNCSPAGGAVHRGDGLGQSDGVLVERGDRVGRRRGLEVAAVGDGLVDGEAGEVDVLLEQVGEAGAQLGGRAVDVAGELSGIWVAMAPERAAAVLGMCWAAARSLLYTSGVPARTASMASTSVLTWTWRFSATASAGRSPPVALSMKAPKSAR